MFQYKALAWTHYHQTSHILDNETQTLCIVTLPHKDITSVTLSLRSAVSRTRVHGGMAEHLYVPPGA